ncbi:MAG: STAS domain-containing protein [Bacillota bacterium]
MKLNRQIQGDMLIVRLQGELDMETVPVFKQKIIQTMVQEQLTDLILNLEGVKFIDSTGIGAILGRYRELKDQGGTVSLVAPGQTLTRIFSLSGMLKLMPVYEDEDTALISQAGKGVER